MPTRVRELYLVLALFVQGSVLGPRAQGHDKQKSGEYYSTAGGNTHGRVAERDWQRSKTRVYAVFVGVLFHSFDELYFPAR